MRQLLPGVTDARDRLAEASRRLQARFSAFMTRKEVLKASLDAADAAIRVRETIAASGLADSGDDWPLGEPDEEAGIAEARLRDLTARLEQELGCEACPDDLTELQPGAPDNSDVRILFAVEPPGTALLIAVLEGSGAIDDRYLEAVMASAEALRRIRAGDAPEAAAYAYADTQSLLAEFPPGDASGEGDDGPPR
jgi:hypothetical protein